MTVNFWLFCIIIAAAFFAAVMRVGALILDPRSEEERVADYIVASSMFFGATLFSISLLWGV